MADDQAVVLLRRFVALGPHGHKANPISEADRPIIVQANFAEPDMRRSTLCWDCDRYGDQEVAGGGGKTWGDEYHEAYEVYEAARAYLATLDA